MDNLDQYYKEHRSKMDRELPADSLWEKIEGQLEPPDEKPIVEFRMIRWSALAASLALLLSIAYWQFKPSDFGKTMSPNSSFVSDVILDSPEGIPVPLEDLRGKVVLVQFWASWCNVCHEKNCNELLPIYDKYKNDGFEIYAISLDENRFQWEYGIERDQLPWIQVSDLKGFDSPISQKWGVNSTYTTFLLDQDQQLIGKNLSREELENKLESCYQKVIQ